MRFSLAREAGLTEHKAQYVDDNFASADFDPSWIVALDFTDHFLKNPGTLPADLSDAVHQHFDPGQQIELALGLGLFHGFSKMLIALGLEPDQMDTTVLPTPEAPGIDLGEHALDDPQVSLLTERPDLASRWQFMHEELLAVGALSSEVLEAARTRVAQLIGVSGTSVPVAGAGELGELAVELAELFVIDARAITRTHIESLRRLSGDGGVVQLIMALAVYDGICRVQATLGPAGSFQEVASASDEPN